VAGPAAQGGPPVARLQQLRPAATAIAAALTGFALAAGAPQAATADAWVAPAGNTISITTVGPAGGSGQPELEVYLEQGLGHGFAVVVSPTARGARAGRDGFERLTALRWGHSLGTVSGVGLVGSVQLGLVEAQGWDPREPLPRPRDAYTTVEPRVALGANLPGRVWVDLSVAARGCPGPLGWQAPLRWQAAAGRNLAGGGNLIVKAWSTGGGCGEPAVTWQLSRVDAITPAIGIETGWRLAGPVRPQPGSDSPRGAPVSGPVIALWVRY
jgi:hypothetical protein